MKILFGFESEISKRNIIVVLNEFPEIGLQGVKLRKFGQKVIHMVSGKRIHSTGAIAGGMKNRRAKKNAIIY